MYTDMRTTMWRAGGRFARRAAGKAALMAAIIAMMAAVAAPSVKPVSHPAQWRLVDYTAYDGTLVNDRDNGYNGTPALCLDGDLNHIWSDGARVQVWGCNGWQNQNWAFHVHSGFNGDGGPWYTITNDYDGKCLDADATTLPQNGTKVQLWTCNGWLNQSWLIYQTWPGVYVIKNGKYPNICLDANLTTLPQNGTRVQIWACNGWANQRWDGPVGLPLSW